MARSILLDEDHSTQAVHIEHSRKSGEKRSREEQSLDDTMPLASIKGVKKHARYEPVVPLPKHELTKWRKEARRVRNRESAAASRRKTRERIEELESQVTTLEHKYSTALQRIAELEQATILPTMNTVSPSLEPRSVRKPIINDWSLDHSSTRASAPLTAPSVDHENSILTTSDNMESFPTLEQHHTHQQNLNLMISRPTAVCVN